MIDCIICGPNLEGKCPHGADDIQVYVITPVQRIADLETQRRIEIERAEFWANKCRTLEQLLEMALPMNMGGTPDLFGPDGGWDTWEKQVVRAIGLWSPNP